MDCGNCGEPLNRSLILGSIQDPVIEGTVQLRVLLSWQSIPV
jgi:hypothetical protein